MLDTMRQDYVEGRFTYSDIFHTIQSMLIAAIDTTSTCTALVWSNLARWPEWQERASKPFLGFPWKSRRYRFGWFSSLSKEIVREEVENIPLSQIRKWDDVPKLAAFMYECIRWNPVIHRNLFHSSTRNIEVGGFSFSKDTLFSFNVAGWRWQTISWNPRQIMKLSLGCYILESSLIKLYQWTKNIIRILSSSIQIDFLIRMDLWRKSFPVNAISNFD